MPVNLPPSQADFDKLLRDVEQLKRAFRAGGPTTFAELGDVDVDFPIAAGDLPTWDTTSSKWKNAPGGGSLITSSYYEFIDDGTTIGKLPTAGDVENKWDTVGGFNNGSDVSLSSGKVIFNTTGIYSISATWDVLADTVGDAYDYALGRFTAERSNEPGSPVHDFVILDDLKVPVLASSGKHTARFSITFVGFMFAGDDVICETRFESSGVAGSNWSIQTASMYIERLT